MGVAELVFLAFGLSMDACAVSICKGFAMKRASIREGITCGLWFGGFQAFMPLVGFYLGSLFSDAIAAIDHWVAFGLLGIIGINMLREAFAPAESEYADPADCSVKTMSLLALATSIDALAVGISLAMTGHVNIGLAAGLIGIITCLMSALGVKIGSLFGSRFEKKTQILGGVLLILIGIKILLEHLGVWGK